MSAVDVYLPLGLKAARLPATLTVPMILFILPTLFIVLVGPAMIDVYDNIAK